MIGIHERWAVRINLQACQRDPCHLVDSGLLEMSKRGETEVSTSIKSEAETDRSRDLESTGVSWHLSKRSRACMGLQLMHRILLRVAGAGAR